MRNASWLAVLLLVLLQAPSSVVAQVDRAGSGAWLVDAFDGFDRQGHGLQKGMAVGYVVGVSDALLPGIVCVPAGVTLGQKIKVVDKYLDDNPAKHHEEAVNLVTDALVKAFPCKE